MKRWIALLLCLLLALPAAAAGDAADPAVTHSYITQVWQPKYLQSVSALAQQAMTPLYRSAMRNLAEKAAEVRRAQNAKTQYALGQVFLKQGDVLYPATGCKLFLREGVLSAGSGLINITDGTASSSVAVGKLYMQSDTPSGGMAVSSPTAELWIDGYYHVAPSAAIDYGSLASALTEMGLFRGMGSGAYLERSATRAQALVMFLRLLGKESEALKCTYQIPFADVPRAHWAYGYVAYAYREGLTNGTSQSTFSPDAPVTAQHYLTFLMRALHYTEGTDFTYNTVLSDCVKDELFGKNEIAAISSGLFARRGLVYLSYYGLLCADGKSGNLLLDDLIANGTLTQQAAAKGLAAAANQRKR